MLTNNNVYRLLSVQIPYFWDAIKFGCVQADEVLEVDMPLYLNELLQALLSDKAQCFVILDNERILQGITITRIVADKIFSKKELLLQTFYSLKVVTDDETQKYFKILYDLAVKEKCTAITFSSRNTKIWEMAKLVGCKELNRNFAFELGGN